MPRSRIRELKNCKKCSGLGYIVTYRTENVWNERLKKQDKKITSMHTKCSVCLGKGKY